MKRQIILILTLVLLIVLTGGTYFAVDHYQKQKNEKQQRKQKRLAYSSMMRILSMPLHWKHQTVPSMQLAMQTTNGN